MEKHRNIEISAFTLHLLAMVFMLCDHIWATVVTGNNWLTNIGRIAFPIFAFMITEGWHYTKNRKKYCLRLLVFALISEIPFNLMYSGELFYPFHQNVLWTFLLSIGCISLIERARQQKKWWLTILAAAGVILLGALLGTVLMVDYFGTGVLTVLVFYLFRGRKWWQMLGQLAGLYGINVLMLGGLVFPVEIFGYVFDIPQQGLALLALIPIWLYHGKQGPHNKGIQYAFYAFYPAHMLLLAAVRLIWIS